MPQFDLNQLMNQRLLEREAFNMKGPVAYQAPPKWVAAEMESNPPAQTVPVNQVGDLPAPILDSRALLMEKANPLYDALSPSPAVASPSSLQGLLNRGAAPARTPVNPNLAGNMVAHGEFNDPLGAGAQWLGNALDEAQLPFGQRYFAPSPSFQLINPDGRPLSDREIRDIDREHARRHPATPSIEEAPSSQPLWRETPADATPAESILAKQLNQQQLREAGLVGGVADYDTIQVPLSQQPYLNMQEENWDDAKVNQDLLDALGEPAPSGGSTARGPAYFGPVDMRQYPLYENNELFGAYRGARGALRGADFPASEYTSAQRGYGHKETGIPIDPDAYVHPDKLGAAAYDTYQQRKDALRETYDQRVKEFESYPRHIQQRMVDQSMVPKSLATSLGIKPTEARLERSVSPGGAITDRLQKLSDPNKAKYIKMLRGNTASYVQVGGKPPMTMQEKLQQMQLHKAAAAAGLTQAQTTRLRNSPQLSDAQEARQVEFQTLNDSLPLMYQTDPDNPLTQSQLAENAMVMLGQLQSAADEGLISEKQFAASSRNLAAALNRQQNRLSNTPGFGGLFGGLSERAQYKQDWSLVHKFIADQQKRAREAGQEARTRQTSR